MTLLFALLAAALVFAVAAAAIGRVTTELGKEIYRPRFDLTQAVAFVAEALPAEEAGELTHDDVRRLLSWHVDHLEAVGVVLEEGEPTEGVPVALAGESSIAALTVRARREGHEYSEAHIRAVIAAEVAYLQAIGAIGKPAEDDGA